MNTRVGDGATAPYVFISYSRTDQQYLDRLVAHFDDSDVAIWTDYGIDYGTRWTAAIREAVDSCAAFVVLMTPAAEESRWVEREVLRAEAMGKAILPLLLDGYVFFLLSAVEYEDVSDGRLPSPRFTKRLQHITSTAKPGEPVAARPTITDWLDEGNRLYGLGDFDEALAAFDKALELEPNHTAAHYNRGSALRDLGRHNEALAAYDRALELDPNHVYANHHRGNVLRKLGRHEEALAAYDRALELDPNDTFAHYNRVSLLRELRRDD